MPLKVFINPTYTRKDNADGGIRRVTEAQHKYLKEFDVLPVLDAAQADLINNHGLAMSEMKGLPIVHSGHGLMWSRYAWDAWAHETNREVVAAMKIADAHTVCSEWVAVAVRRGMAVYPKVIYHGVEPNEWEVPSDPQPYVLWNKARQDLVSNPDDMQKLAELLPNVPFLSTLGNPKPNVRLTGVVAFEQMKDIVKHANLYLATARETFGIGTLEAMACGVPVVGWDWGGQSEIIQQGVTGYLAKPGDYRQLAEFTKLALEQRATLSANARHDIETRWTWQPRIQQYADLFREVVSDDRAFTCKVSVIVTSHNLAKYLPDALKSVLSQSMTDWECIIVDDASTDNTKEIAEKFQSEDARFKYLSTPSNLKLSKARNFGFQHSKGRYIIFLDADDMLDEHALKLMSESLDKERGLHIVYGHLDVVNEKGEERRRNDWPNEEFVWRGQMAHYNQLPYCAMMRSNAFARMGGYRERHWRAEDANFWCRATSFGFVAKKVTERSLLIYRMRNDSKSHGEEGDGDWTAWYPWRIAGNSREFTSKIPQIKARTLPKPANVPFGAQGTPPSTLRFWYAHDHAYPKISVVVPVGPGHERYLIDAIESVMAQTYPDWEIIVVNDTGKVWPEGFLSPAAGAPYIKVVSTEGNRGVAHARNLGFKHGKGEAFFPLDADDYILPNCLARMAAYLEEYNGIIYSGWLKNDGDGKPMEQILPPEFECGRIIEKMWHSGSSVLIPRWLHEKIGAWDENIKGWEDWDYQIAAQHHGACSYLVPEPLFVYRFTSGTQREKSWANQRELLEYIGKKWYPYRSGEKTMGCSCKQKRSIVTPPNSSYSSSGNFESGGEQETMILLEYLGPHEGPITVRGPVTGVRYRFGSADSHRFRYVHSEDAQEFLERMVGDNPEFQLPASGGAKANDFAGLEISDDVSLPDEFTVPA